MTLHDFDADLQFSHDQSSQVWWEQVYRQAFPDMISMDDLRVDGWHQRAGRDRAIHLSSGRTLYVDEKTRRETYSDVALEVWSKYPISGRRPYRAVPGAVPGWARKPLDCDWLAYAFLPTRTAHLFPFQGIRAVMEKHAAQLVAKAEAREDGYRWTIANNGSYLSICIAVPIPALHNYLTDALTISWSAAA